MPMAGLTALQALRDHADVKPGNSVLVNGASAFTLEETADALVYLERGVARGKVVVTA